MNKQGSKKEGYIKRVSAALNRERHDRQGVLKNDEFVQRCGSIQFSI
jgi:hypothetical protein